jgi:AraC family transcriptional regulator
MVDIFGQGTYSGNVVVSAGNENLLGCITTYNRHNFNGALHYHENAHFSFLLEGGCVERKKDRYEITPGKITFYQAGEFHQVISVPQPSRRINLELNPVFFEEYRISNDAVRLAITRNPDAKFLMVKMYRELQENDDFSIVSIQMLLLELVLQTARQRQETNWPGWVTQIRDFLHERFSEKITLNELSIAANVSPVTISRYFPKYFGCTLGEYVRKLRIEKSLSLIKTSCLSLTEIAIECGFFDQSHFTRTFKQLHGFLPIYYKKL